MSIDLITLTGGLPRDAELRYTPNGAAVASFTQANSDNRFDEQQNQWVKTRALYLDCTIWNESSERKQHPTPWAELAAELRKGDQIAVKGKLITRSWEKDGQKFSKVEFQATSFYILPEQSNTSAASNGDVWAQHSPQGDDQPPF